MKWLLWLITAVYFAGGGWWYVSIHKKAGNLPLIKDDREANTSDPFESEPFVFRWSSPDEILNPGFIDFRDSIVGLAQSGILEITGFYFSSEDNPTGFDDLGLARADRIRHLFSEELDRDQFILKSEEMDYPDTLQARNISFKAVSLRALGATSDQKEIELPIVIQCPYASEDLLLSPELESLLNDLVIRVNDSREKLVIIGHADNTAGEKRNSYLGYKRAQSVSEKMIALGLNREKIILESKGESQPLASNDTPEGRKTNRRVEIFILSN